jgi:ribosomal-protein-alanine N-acetyltransferase
MTAIREFDGRIDNAIPLADVHKRCFADPWDAQAILRLATPPGFALVHGTPVDAFVLARVAAGEAEILTIAVRPDLRRGGIGRALMRKAADLAQARGAAMMFLEVDAANAAALALYAQLGFAKTGERKGYYRVPGKAPADALVLKAALPLTLRAD